MNFDVFNLHPQILKNVKQLGYQTPTPIQQQSIPTILSGQDILGLAQTGTGKTAAFALPILHRLMASAGRGVRALVIAPTRELAQQIHDAFVKLCEDTSLRNITLYGGVNINPQIKHLSQGVDIVVACPGRLLDHIQQRSISLSNIEIMVIDEADQMFDMGFLPSLRKILKQLPKKRQTLLFSATMPTAIEELAHEVLQEPIVVKIGHIAPATLVKQALYPVPTHLKTRLLIQLLHTIEMQSVLVFTRTKHSAKQISTKLAAAGFRTASLQGNLSQNKRQMALNDFRDGSIQILVATDIASRGIDVADISHVINYDMPSTVEAYIHRIGRTGRAEKVGEAYTLITQADKIEVRNIERALGRTLEQCKIKDFDYAAAPQQPSVNGTSLPKHHRRKWN